MNIRDLEDVPGRSTDTLEILTERYLQKRNADTAFYQFISDSHDDIIIPCLDTPTPPFLCKSSISLDALISDVYEDIENINSKCNDYFCNRAILAPLNVMTKAINKKVLDRFNGEEVKYLAKNTLINENDGYVIQPETLACLNSSGVPEHEIVVKIGVPIIIMRNLRPPYICNGTRARVKSLHMNLIEVTLLTGPGAGEDVLIPRIKTIPNDNLKFMRTQFPIQLCFAMTINKAQGQTFKRVGVDLSSPCFSHGQLYVALSRVGNAEDVFVLTNDNLLKNVVYDEVF